MTFSPVGNLAAVSIGDKTIQLQDVTTEFIAFFANTLVWRLRDRVQSDGRWFAAGGKGELIKLWGDSDGS